LKKPQREPPPLVILNRSLRRAIFDEIDLSRERRMNSFIYKILEKLMK
jgi:hypothetical protein